MKICFLALVFLLGLLPSRSWSHPVPQENHDRTITVQIKSVKNRTDQIRILVQYRLEVDEFTVWREDMEPFRDEVDIAKFQGKGLAYYQEFTRLYAPIYADHLIACVDGQPLEFQCALLRVFLKDDQGVPLGHLRCDFEFEAFAKSANTKTLFEFEEKNYWLQRGKIILNLESDFHMTNRWVPDEVFRKRVEERTEPGDEQKLRQIAATILPDFESTPPPVAAAKDPAPTPRLPDHDEYSLMRLFLHADQGFWMLLLLAFFFGAAHALTPGHGKTLVAAYLVGEQGTIWHALALGIITTLTHTGAVLLIAGLLFFIPEEGRTAMTTWLQHGLGLAMGLLVVCTGFWLLLQRLAGRADHFHLSGDHHHHSHTQAPTEKPKGIRWLGLILLGITGGLVPCWDAIYLLLFTVGRNEFWVALPTLLAFSTGLAGVLVLIGILVVQVPNFARSRWGEGRLVRALPILSALIVTSMGLWLCYESIHGP